MAKNSPYAAIDVGTTKICTVVGNVSPQGDIQVLGVGVSPARGLRKGIVVDIDETTESIQSSVEKAERASGTKVVSAQVGITGGHIGSLNNRGTVAIARSDRVISPDDVRRVLESARTLHIPTNRQVIHVIPRIYTLDGQEGVTNPVGMHGFRLDVETHIVTGAVTSIQNLTKCVQQVGVEVEDLVLEPLASGVAVLTEEEREMGVVLADIGGGTTDIAVFIEGSIWHTSILSVGGNHLTRDIVIGLSTPLGAAEEIKLRYGHALPSAIDPEETIEIASFGAEGHRPVLRRKLCDLIRARVEEIMGMIMVEIKRSGYDAMLPAGLVLTGGTANLPGIDALAREVVGLPVRIGFPRGIYGLVDEVSNPAFATSIGLLLWGLRHGEPKGPTKNGRSFGELYRRLIGWVKELLPQ